MSKHNLGRVRRYRSSFYLTRRFWIRRICTILVFVAVLFAIGWFAGPPVVDFCTHTWYNMKNGGDSSNKTPVSSDMVPEQEPEEPAASEPESEPEEAAAQGAQEMDTSAGWSYVTLSALGSEETARATAQSLAAQGVKYAVVTLKDKQGYIYYLSGQELAASSVAATTLDVTTAIRVLREEEITLVANLYMYQDPVAPYTDKSRAAAVMYQDETGLTDYYWLDAAPTNGGKPWLSPYSQLAGLYLDGLLDEVENLGFEQILLSGVQYPNGASAHCYYGPMGDVPMTEQLARRIDAWQSSAAEKGVTVWVEYSLATAAATEERGGSSLLGGGTLADLGVENLMITLPDEPDENTDALLAQALENSSEAEYRVVRSGNTASFE